MGASLALKNSPKNSILNDCTGLKERQTRRKIKLWGLWNIQFNLNYSITQPAKWRRKMSKVRRVAHLRVSDAAVVNIRRQVGK